MPPVAVRFRWLLPLEERDLPLPQHASAQAAGMDVAAALKEETVLRPGAIRLIPTGFAAALPEGFELQVRPRSGLAVRHGITVVNAPGTIDADYRGEIMIALINLSQAPFTIRRGDRIAQLVLAPVCRADWQVVDSLDLTERGGGGFGHTGL
ncbi:dUTP diphosphatase [Candidatus Electronema sp. JC]|uniref:dUTP diphosphatase n=1 Tax=Candidatus Electronema sp. JC TaxID=3401570 RepID=UPI003AA8F269